MTGTGSEPSTQPARRVAAWRTCASEPCACVRRRILVENVRRSSSFLRCFVYLFCFSRSRMYDVEGGVCVSCVGTVCCGRGRAHDGTLSSRAVCSCRWGHSASASRGSRVLETSCCTWVAKSVARGGGAGSQLQGFWRLPSRGGPRRATRAATGPRAGAPRTNHLCSMRYHAMASCTGSDPRFFYRATFACLFYRTPRSPNGSEVRRQPNKPKAHLQEPDAD
jgi:hypothetical protein